MVMSAIDQLESELQSWCAVQLLAPDQETAQKWYDDDFLHLTRGYRVNPMPDRLQPLVHAATAEWKQTETRICEKLGLDRQEFLRRFEEARSDFLKNGEDWKDFVLETYPAVCAAVKNMGWVSLFSWLLPFADYDHAKTHRDTGRFIVAAFYIETLYDYRIFDRYGANMICRDPIMKLEARWRLASMTSAGRRG